MDPSTQLDSTNEAGILFDNLLIWSEGQTAQDLTRQNLYHRASKAIPKPHSLLVQYIFKRIKPWSAQGAFFFLTFPTALAKLSENMKATMAFHVLLSHSVQGTDDLKIISKESSKLQ